MNFEGAEQRATPSRPIWQALIRPVRMSERAEFRIFERVEFLNALKFPVRARHGWTPAVQLLRCERWTGAQEQDSRRTVLPLHIHLRVPLPLAPPLMRFSISLPAG